jgi:hypothetical protein
MPSIQTLRADVVALLRAEFLTTVEYQFSQNRITVTMTFDEYLTLWSPARIAAISLRLEQGGGKIDRYMKDRFNRPVCSWKRREDREIGGTMSVDDARIMRAEDSRRMFQFQAGDSHSEVSRKRIGDTKRGKKQSEAQIEKRTAARVATMAAKRAALAGSTGTTASPETIGNYR